MNILFHICFNIQYEYIIYSNEVCIILNAKKTQQVSLKNDKELKKSLL